MVSAVKRLHFESAGDLQPYLLLAIGARIMITKNIWVQASIVNGAMGTLCGIVPGSRNQLHELPACLLIELDQYSGPPFSFTSTNNSYPTLSYTI